MSELDRAIQELKHDLLLIQRKIDISLVAIGIAIGNLIGLTLGLIVAGL